MNNRIESFPMINDDILDYLNIKLNLLEANYSFNGQVNNLECLIDDENINQYILDNNGVWSSKINELNIIGSIEISNYNILYEEYKVANIDTILGVAITCVSIGSTKTCTKPIGEISYNGENKCVVNFKIHFDKGELSSLLSLKFSIYVKKINKESNINIYAKKIGTVLGEIYNCKILLEGQGSEFPIFTIENPEGPLWEMEVDFELLEQVFSPDTICLKINKSHKDFTKLGVDKISGTNNLIWKEILATFFTNLFVISNEIESLDSLYDENYLKEQGEGTVGDFLKIQLEQFHISVNEIRNISTLSVKIRKELDNLL